MRYLIVFLRIITWSTMGMGLLLADQAIADESRVNIIFTGVVPPTCAVEMPAFRRSASATASGNRETVSQSEGIQNRMYASCNTDAQIDYQRDATGFDPESTAEFPSDEPSEANQAGPAMPQGVLTVTPR